MWQRWGVCAALLLLLARGVEGQEGCQTVFVPDLAPPGGVQTGVITSSYPIPPSTTSLFYPFNIHTDTYGNVLITQEVGEPWARWRLFTSQGQVSLVYSFIQYPGAVTYEGRDYALDAGGVWRSIEDSMPAIAYTTLPNTPPPGGEATWAFREDYRAIDRTLSGALSKPLQLGEGWNIGVWAPYGVREFRQQAQLRLCPRR